MRFKRLVAPLEKAYIIKKRSFLMGFGLFLVLGFLFSLCASGFAESVEHEIKALKARIFALEKKVSEQGEEQGKQKEFAESHKKDFEAVQDLKKALAHIEFSGGVTGIVQGTSGIDNGDSADGEYTADFNIAAHFWKSGSFFFHIEGGDGEGLNDDVPSFSVPNYDSYATTNHNKQMDLTVSQAYYEFSFFEHKARVDVGKMDISPFFDQNEAAGDETTQFLSNIFVKSMGLTIPEPDNYYCPGIALTLSPVDILEFSFVGASVEDNNWEDIFDNGFGVAQFNFRPNIKGHQGNYRFYVWMDDRRHLDNSNLGIVSAAYEDAYADEMQKGWGISFDQEVIDGITAFIRYSQTDDDLASWNEDDNQWEMLSFDRVWSCGTQINGQYWSRSDDAIGIAYGQVLLTDDYKSANDHTGKEQYIETYYRFQFNEYFALTGDFQWIKNAGGDSESSDIYIWGLRTQLDF